MYRIVLQTLSRNRIKKSKITNILNSDRKVHNHMAKSIKTHQKRMDKNCHIPDLVHAFSNVENSGLNHVLQRQTTHLYEKKEG